MFGSPFSPSHLHSHSLSEGSLWPKHRWMNDITWGPWLIRNLSTQIIKNAHISVCFLVIYYDFTMSHTVETMGLISKGIAIYEELYFPFMMPGSYHCNYSLSFNSVDLTFALLERFKYIRFLIKKKKPLCISEARVHYVILNMEMAISSGTCFCWWTKEISIAQFSSREY